MPRCPACGESNAARARFCSSCGSPLPEAASPGREVRKTVSIVFSDVVGSTALAEALDPETLGEVMVRYFSRMRDILERHGGTVEKFIGDAVMAVFGHPVLHEDDALRAVRAACEMREALQELNRDLQATYGVEIATRTGVNTGEVVAADPTSEQTLPLGDAANTAARLEQSAGPGEILLGEATYRLVKDAVVAEPVEPLALKGKRQAVPAWRLREVIPHAPGVARRLDAPLVGRDEELASLLQAFDGCVRDRSCRVVTVVGEAGVGKSRLAQEFAAGVEDRARVLRGRCQPYGEGITFWPVREILWEAAGVREGDDLPAVRTKLRALLAEDSQAAAIGERVGAALGLSEEPFPIEEIFWGIRKLVESLARDRPLVVVVDDVHWAEPTLLDLVEHIATLTTGVSVLLLCPARPDLEEHRPQWGSAPGSSRLAIERLGDREARALVEHLLGAGTLSPQVRSRVMEASGGNPLFVEQLLSYLIEEELLVRDDSRWTATGDLNQLVIPPTISALVDARLDRLPKDERRVIEGGSVVGDEFPARAVQELVPHSARPHLAGHLQALVRRQLLRPGDGPSRYRFGHVLVRTAAYGGIPKRVRADLHQRFADWLEKAPGQQVAELDEVLGYHLEQAHRYLAELAPVDDHGRSLGERAGKFLAAAGHRALARGDAPGAANLLSRALVLVPDTDPFRLDLLPELAEALTEAGEFSRALQAIDDAVRAASEADDRRVQARAVLGRWALRLQVDPQASIDQAAREAERVIPVLEELGDHAGLTRAWALATITRHMRCRFADMSAAAERTAAHARRAGDRHRESQGLHSLTLALLLGPTPVDEALERVDGVLGEARGDRMVEAVGLVCGGVLRAMRGEIRGGRAAVARGREMLWDLGLRYQAAIYSQGSAAVEKLAGDLGQAERHLREGYQALERMGETARLSTAAGFLAGVYARLGRDQEAERFAGISEATAASEDMGSQVEWRVGLAIVLARRGEAKRAEALAREGVALAASTDVLDLHGDALMDLAHVLHLVGRNSESAEALREALGLFERKGNLVSARRAREALAELIA